MKAKINVNKCINCSVSQGQNLNGIISPSETMNAQTEQDKNIYAGSTQRGAQGIPGEAATIQLGTVSTGEPGTDVIITNSGDEHAAIFNFTIPRGDKGDTGSTGATGATGNGVVNTEYISSSGLVDTYHINYTNGNYDPFTVTNGANGTGTVNSVNNISPDSNGNVTLTASNVGALSNSTKYGADLSYSSNTLQLLDQDGNSLGNSVTIQSSPDIDGISITTNSDDELQTVAVIDQNNTSNAIKTWTGTRAQYDAIVTKDTNTLYNITDDNTADAYEAYTKSEVDTGFVNVNASNLSSTGQKVFDGQWRNSSVIIANSVAWDSTTPVATYSLSSYLPNDGYNYEVLIRAVFETSTTQNSFVTVNLKSDYITDWVSLGTARTRTTSVVDGSGNVILAVGTGRYIQQYTSTSNNANGKYTLRVIAYRRLGTNS